jgi:hypothetical protein
MKIIITEKQLKVMKGEIDESSRELYRVAERIYNLVKNRPTVGRNSTIDDIVKVLRTL